MGKNLDILELIRFKAFSDLDPEEKSFVLDQVENEDEYDLLRKIILESGDDTEMKSNSKDVVMAAFDEEFSINENSDKKRSRFWPYIAAAATIAVLLVVGSFLLQENEEPLAENKMTEKKDKVNSDSITTRNDEQTSETAESKKEEDLEADEPAQIAELKRIDTKDIKIQKEASDPGVKESSRQIEEIQVQADMVENDDFIDDELGEPEVEIASDYEEVSEVEVSSSSVSGLENSLSETARSQQSAIQTESLSKGNSRRKRKNLNPMDDFKLKRIKKDHYTSY